MQKKEILKNKISEITKENNVFLIDFVWRGSEQNRVIEVYIDNKEGINAEICKVISRNIEEFIDSEKIVPNKYRLDVSSPGIDKPLIYLEQFDKHIGRTLDLLIEKDESEDEITGKLIKIEKDELYFEIDGNEVEVSFKKIKKALVVISF